MFILKPLRRLAPQGPTNTLDPSWSECIVICSSRSSKSRRIFKDFASNLAFQNVMSNVYIYLYIYIH